MNVDRRRCEHCPRILVVHVIDVIGREFVEDVEFCGCAGSRRAAGICRDCSNKVSGRRHRCDACRAPKVEWVKHVDADRRRAGICQRCESPVVGKMKVALYCEPHRRAAAIESTRKHLAKVGQKHARTSRARHRKKLNRRMRAYARKHRQRMNDYKREWRKKNRDKVRAQKRRHALRGRAAAAMRLRRERIARGEIAPPKPTPRNERGERLCLGTECTAVVHGRAKMCDACRADRRAAADLRRAA